MTDVRNGNELVFDVYKELSAVSLKSYINIQLTNMVLKVTQDGESSLIHTLSKKTSLYFTFNSEINSTKLNSFHTLEFSGAGNQKRSDDVRKSFYDKYVQNQNTVKNFLRTVSDKKWTCDRRTFPRT